jgi:chemotaxis protein histidine kinase CheA
MKSLRHSKFKNTGVLFELLVRQVASDTLNNIDSKAIVLIKKYFAKSTELSKEFNLYQTLIKEKYSKGEKANHLIEAVLIAKSRLNQSILNRQKYNLIKEIKTNYGLEVFFKTKVNNYKPLAAIFKLFEYTIADNPVESVNNRYTIVEHITRSLKSSQLKELNEMSTFIKQDKDIRLLSYKILVDKFNEKYTNLNEAQKTVLRQYINTVSDGVELKDFIVNEVNLLQKDLKRLTSKVTDKVTKIKLVEVSSILNKISSVKIIKDAHILSLLRYHELVKELKKI